jgi:hypothetical protein
MADWHCRDEEASMPPDLYFACSLQEDPGLFGHCGIASTWEQATSPFADAWIAAAAPQLNVPLATHNARDYAGIQNLVVMTAPATV